MESKDYSLLGVKVNLLEMSQLNSLIGEAVQNKTKWIIANHNLNSLYIYHHNPQMRDFYSLADYTHIDGMALVLLGRFLKFPFERKHRVTYADWVWSLMAEASKQNWRILYLGSKPGVAEKGAKIVQTKHPNLQIETINGYFDATPDSEENQAIIDRINAYKPHVLMVGMGMPRQEQWIADNLEKLETNAILPSGACIDYVAGAVVTPPRWMGKAGLEWLYRLMSEPKRLWRRYLIEPWFILKLFIIELWNSYFIMTKEESR